MLRKDAPLVLQGEEFAVHGLQFTVRIENVSTVNCRL